MNETMQDAAVREGMREKLTLAVMAPVRAMRREYLPLLMVYFAYGALGLTAIAESFWIKRDLDWSPAELAGLGVWLTLPWTIKMVFGELVDTVPVLGSQRRAYVFIGAGMIALSLLLLAAAAGKWTTALRLDQLYVIASLLTVLGVVLQDVVADAMSTEVVPRVDADGAPRPQADVDRDLGMVQVLGRLALGFGILSVAGVSGWLAKYVSYETVFLCGLVVPLISVSGALLVKLETQEQRRTDWRILGGGLLFGTFVVLMALGGLPFNQEIVFVVSLVVIIWMLSRVVGEIDAAQRRRIAYAAMMIFAFRAVPSVGEGYRWFTIDVLGFDEGFYGTLQQIGAVLTVASTWLLSDFVTRRPVPQVLLWITLAVGVLSLPAIALAYRVDEWTQRVFGFGAHTIMLIDSAAVSPLDQLGMIPLLTLSAIYAPARHRAIWFALMASLMNLALVAGQLQTKYLNEIFPVARGNYTHLPAITVASTLVGLAIPLLAIRLFGRRV